MGKLDQHAKLIFSEETGSITHQSCSFIIPPETPLHEVRADGRLLVGDKAALAHLAAPWCLADEDEIVIELKLKGDKLDRRRFDRALLRRQAREVERREQEKGKWEAEMPLWVLAPHKPRWLSKVRDLTLIAQGVYRVGPSPFDFLWIVANQLPLKPELIPFLLARTDQKLVEFGKWVLDHRELEWLTRMIEVLPMTIPQIDELKKYFPETDDPERLKRRELIAHIFLEHVPSLKQALKDEGEAQGLSQGLRPLVHQFERRLGRPLSPQEHQTLLSRFDTLGPEQLGDVILDLSASELALWLEERDLP